MKICRYNNVLNGSVLCIDWQLFIYYISVCFYNSCKKKNGYKSETFCDTNQEFLRLAKSFWWIIFQSYY